MISVLLMMIMKTIDIVVEIKHNMFELFLLCVVTSMCFLVSIKKRFCTLRLLFFIFKHFVRFLFEGGFYFLFLNILCGFYSRAASIQGRLLFKKIRYFAFLITS